MDKVKVRLDNRVLQIPAEDKEKYLQLGYTVYDMNGNLIDEPATDKKKLKDAKAEIASLTAKLKEEEEYAESRDKELDALKAELSVAKADVATRDAEIASLMAKLKESQKAEAAAKTAAAKAAKTSGKTAENTEK